MKLSSTILALAIVFQHPTAAAQAAESKGIVAHTTSLAQPNLNLPDAITGKPGDQGCGPTGLPLPGPTGCYPYREPLPAPPPGGPPPGPPALGPAPGELPPPTFGPPVPAPAQGGQ